ncbi:hypothetical protein WAI99_22145, partial [Acinetobacter baumannii]
LESTGARMNRLGSSVLAGVPLLSLDETVSRIDAVTVDDLVGLAREVWDPGRLCLAGIGPDEALFRAAVAPLAAAGVAA